MEYANMLIVALVIVKECLAPEIVIEDEIERSKYLQKLIRLVIRMNLIASAIIKKLVSEFKDIIRLNTTTREIFKDEIGPVSIDNSVHL